MKLREKQKRFWTALKEFNEAMDYSATDYTFDRIAALEKRVSELESEAPNS